MGQGMSIESISFEPGFMVLTDERGERIRQPVSAILRALDIPEGLDYTQIPAIPTLANLVVVLIRTLINRQVLDESFMEDNEYSLHAIIQSIEGLGGDYGEPNITP